MRLFLSFPLFLFLISTSCSKKMNMDALVRKEIVKRASLRDVIEQTGEVQPVVKVEIKSEASGQIDTVFVTEGERLRTGQRILRIDPTQLLSRRAKLVLSHEKAQIVLSQAKRDLENAEELVKMGTISVQKAEDARNSEALAGISLKDIELELKDIDYQLSKTVILAPMNGVLTALNVEKGEIVISATQGFSGGTSIGTIADLSKLEILTKVGEADYTRIYKGQKVSIRLESNRERTTTGVVTFVAVAAKKETGSEIGQFEVKVGIDSAIAGLVPGVNVTASFIVLDKKDVISIPYMFVNSIPNGGYFAYRSSHADIPEKDELRRGAGGAEKGQPNTRGSRTNPEGKIDKRLIKAREEKRRELEKLGLKRQRITVGETDFMNYEVIGGLKEGDTVYLPLADDSRSGR